MLRIFTLVKRHCTISSKDGKFSLKKQPNNCDSRLVIALSQQKFTISSKDGKFSLKKQPNNCDSRLVIALSQQKFSVLQYANNGSDCICDKVIFIFWVFCSFTRPQRIFLKPETHQRMQVKQSCYDILYLYGLSLLVSFLGGFVIIVHDS